MKRRNFLASTKHRLYRERRFKNPDVKRKLSIKWRLIIGSFVFCCFVISLPFMLSYAPAFTIQEITIDGISSIPEQEIRSIIEEQMNVRPYRLFSQKSSFFFNEEALLQRLNDQYDFKSLDIDLERTSLHIYAEERIVQLIWISGVQHAFVDLEGLVSSQLSDEQVVEIQSRLNNEEFLYDSSTYQPLQNNIPVIIDLSGEEIEEGAFILDSSVIESIILLDDLVREDRVIPLKYEVEGVDPSYFTLISSLGVPVRFTAHDSIEDQLRNLEVITGQIEDFNGTEYIDLRFGNHVFVK